MRSELPSRQFRWVRQRWGVGRRAVGIGSRHTRL